MSSGKNSYDNRNLSEVFQELKAMQNPNYNGQANTINSKPAKKVTGSSSRTKEQISNPNDLKISHIVIGSSILILGMAMIFPKNLSYKTSYANEEIITNASEYELNRHRLNMQSIISENAGMNRVKGQIIEEREVEFETTYNNNPTLPKGEEVIKQEGALGKDKVTAIQTYENGTFVEEIILAKERTLEPTSKIIDLGTSEFLAKHNIHIGDTMYLANTATLKASPDDSSADVAEVKKSLDVKLLELPSEEWCKVSFDNIEGYIKTSGLTSPALTPNIIEKNRVQRILIKVNIGMELNKVSGLTLNDYKKIFTALSNDTNKIFEDNYTTFYNIEKKYNINGIFLASMAIHESAWGTSQIAQEKKNLFGYGSYDNTPYESSFEFETYSEGIETVAKSLVKYYLNPVGTKIYDGETALAWYFNGPTLYGVNQRYASDTEWHKKVYNYMEMLYNRLQS